MEASVFFGILFIILSFELWVKIVISLFKKNYYETYYSLHGQLGITYRFFYGLIFDNKIYKDGVKTKYSWILIPQNKLEDFFKENKIYASIERFKILDNFKDYMNNDFENDEELKFLLKKQDLYTDLKNLYLEVRDANE